MGNHMAFAQWEEGKIVAILFFSRERNLIDEWLSVCHPKSTTHIYFGSCLMLISDINHDSHVCGGWLWYLEKKKVSMKIDENICCSFFVAR